MSKSVTWVKYVWPLPERDFESPLPDGYAARLGRPDEATDFARISGDAYASDPTWAPMIKSIRQRMSDKVEQTYGLGKEAYATPSLVPLRISTHSYNTPAEIYALCDRIECELH